MTYDPNLDEMLAWHPPSTPLLYAALEAAEASHPDHLTLGIDAEAIGKELWLATSPWNRSASPKPVASVMCSRCPAYVEVGATSPRAT